MDNFEFFPVNDFRRWMKDHSADEEFKPSRKKINPIGLTVESKVGSRRLLQKMQPESGEIEELSMDFLSEGGTVIDVDGKTFLIEVASGEFYIERRYVSKT
jgi:hypothetical protein